jgi:aldehyde dehydrogenase (NAD+)
MARESGTRSVWFWDLLFFEHINSNLNGYHIEPTIFKNVSHDEILREEIFGPVAIVSTFKTESEVIELSNNTEHGLMAAVFTQDINRALRVASAFGSGMVGINCIGHMFLNTPFGGAKQSGLSRECGRESLLAYTDRKTIMVNLTY